MPAARPFLPRARRTSLPARLRAWTVTVLLVLAVSSPLTLTARPALAAGPSIQGLRVTRVTATSFTVRLTSLGKGWRYHLYASTDKADLYYDELPRAPHRSASAKKPKITLRHLPAAAGPYWFRMQATKGRHHHTSDIGSVGLRPGVPTALQVRALTRGALSLTWQGSAGGYDVQLATDRGFKAGAETVRVAGGGRQLTPAGLAAGRRYWFRVRAVNAGTRSPWTPAVAADATAHGVPVRVMTYNLLTLDDDGTTPPGAEPIAAWSSRRLAAARLVTSAGPGVLAVQEGAAWVGAARGPRQVDSLRSALGPSWSLARTEVPPDEPHYFRTGVYVLFDHTRYASVGTGGHWDLGEKPDGGSRWAAYQVLRERSSGATFLVVSLHLYAIDGTVGDRLREEEAASMVHQASAYASAHGDLPVVYAGDVNSHERHAVDGPRIATQASGTADALLSAPHRSGERYNTANRYLRVPPASGLAIDRVYAAPGVAVLGWRQVLELSGGRFAGVIPSDHNPVVSDLVVPR